MQRLGQGREACVYALSDTQCIKLFAVDCDMRKIESEATRMQFAYERGIPVPRFYGMKQIDGRMGICMERLNGRIMLRQALLTGTIDPMHIRMFALIQKQYHDVQAPELGNIVSVLAWQIEQDTVFSQACHREMIARLQKMPREYKLVHMDYHLDNVMVTPDGLRVIDWTGARAGNPLADMARTLLTFEPGTYPVDADAAMRDRIDQMRSLLRKAYLQAYPADTAQLLAWRSIIAAARLYCCSQEERLHNQGLVMEALDR